MKILKNLPKEKKFLSIVIISAMVTMMLATITNNQSVSAIGPKQELGASEFAPGHLKSSDEQSQSAKEFAPGIIQGRLPVGGCDAPLNSPGHLFKQSSTTT